MISTQQFAAHLRKNLTEAEKILWSHLRRRQILGYKFRRQFPIDKYIVDFICLEKYLIVEADGGQHNESVTDKIRDGFLQQRGFEVLRFWNHEIMNNIDAVLEVIANSLQEK